MQMRRMYDFVDRGRRAVALRSDAAECARKGFPGLAEANMELAEILSPTPREVVGNSQSQRQNKTDYPKRNRGNYAGGVINGPVNGGGGVDRNRGSKPAMASVGPGKAPEPRPARSDGGRAPGGPTGHRAPHRGQPQTYSSAANKGRAASQVTR